MDRQERLLEIFFRCLRGEEISVQKLAQEYGVSTKSISRNLNDLKAFLAEHRELVGSTELEYSYQNKCYRLHMDEFLTNQEMFALVEVMIGARAFSKMELLTLISKLKRFTTAEDRKKLEPDYQQGTAPLPGGKARLRQRHGDFVAADRLHHRAEGNYRRVLPDGPEMGHPPTAVGGGDVHRFLLLPDCL